MHSAAHRPEKETKKKKAAPKRRKDPVWQEEERLGFSNPYRKQDEPARPSGGPSHRIDRFSRFASYGCLLITAVRQFSLGCRGVAVPRRITHHTRRAGWWRLSDRRCAEAAARGYPTTRCFRFFSLTCPMIPLADGVRPMDAQFVPLRPADPGGPGHPGNRERQRVRRAWTKARTPRSGAVRIAMRVQTPKPILRQPIASIRYRCNERGVAAVQHACWRSLRRAGSAPQLFERHETVDRPLSVASGFTAVRRQTAAGGFA